MKLNQKDFIKQISDDTGYTQGDISKVFESIEKKLLENLKEQNSIKLVSGVVFSSKFVPARESINPKTQEPVTTSAKIKCSVKFSNAFKEKVNM